MLKTLYPSQLDQDTQKQLSHKTGSALKLVEEREYCLLFEIEI